MQPPEGPPVCTALKRCPSWIPPILKIISRNVVPIGTSIKPLFLTRPARANIFVPLLFSVPSFAYQSPPSRIMRGIWANVSTLLIRVGEPHNPTSAGNGGRGRGVPRLPSIDAISAVSSPQTKAPAPSRNSTLKVKDVPKIFLPSSPKRSAWCIAVLRRLIASGYSART